MAYIVNGLGRCGTTLMFNFLTKYYASQNFIKDLSTLDDVDLKTDVVYKTHSLNTIVKDKANVKMLFMFGNIYNSVLSYRPRIKSIKPLEHLFIEKNFKEDYLDKDIFEFGRYFKKWYKPLGYPVMFVRYESLYDNLKEVLDFCDVGKEIDKFPEFMKRKTNWKQTSEKEREALIKLYGKDQELFSSIPDIKLFN